MSEFKRICALRDLPEGRTFPVTVGDIEIVLVRQGDHVFALEDCCTHQDFPLSQGEVSGDRLRCRAHGAEFCLKTGAAKSPPAHTPVRTFEVKVVGGEVLLAV
jgi:3-phenylpropionate/trans-cinnamate dioxygenase ferredoxin subunit